MSIDINLGVSGDLILPAAQRCRPGSGVGATAYATNSKLGSPSSGICTSTKQLAENK